MEKAIKIITAATGILVAVAEIMKQVNQYNASKESTESTNSDTTAEK